MLPKAFSESALFNIDPVYSAEEMMPPSPDDGSKGVWIYGQYEYESFLLERMFREKNEAKLKVGYTKFRKVPRPELFFSARFEGPETLFLRTTGERTLFFWQGEGKAERKKNAEGFLVAIPGKGVLTLQVSCSDVEKEIPALQVADAPERWSCSDGSREKITPVLRPARKDGMAPHHASMPLVELEGEKIRENVWDAGRELLAYIEVTLPGGETPDIFVGESLPEMENCSAADEEQTRELTAVAPGVFRSKVPLAFRYLRVENAPCARVRFKALFHPAVYKGAFSVPGDDLLTKIWMHSAYTLRLCMMNFFNDGIKRDRLPWAGDLAVSLLGNSCSFTDNTMVRDTLSILGAVSVKTAHINTIVDYTLWHLVSHDIYQRYSGDMGFLQKEYPRLAETLDFLLGNRRPDGMMQLDPEKDWIFIDWVEGEKTTALQILFIMALRAGAALAERLEDFSRVRRLLDAAAQAEAAVKSLCFDRSRGLFAAAPGSREFSRHPNMLAVIAGIADPEMKNAIADALASKELPAVGTPYMSVFESLALARCGRHAEALARVKEIWGGMLELGATTFWEGFDPSAQGDEHLVFYLRPFGKSLCHAWSSGPLFLLPEIMLGLHPVKDGWKEYTLAPLPGVTANAVIPVPGGRITAECREGRIVSLTAPEECKRV